MVLFEDSNIATEEMLKAQAEVFLRIPANKNINFLSDKDCDEMESLLGKAGIKASCEPNEMIQGGVNIHTMSPERAVVDVLSKAGYEVNEQADEDQNIQRIKDLAGL